MPDGLKSDANPSVWLHPLQPNGLNVHAGTVAKADDLAKANCVPEHKRTAQDDVSPPDDPRTDYVVEGDG